MLILVYDTETTGLVKGTDYTSPTMPLLAAITAILYDTNDHRIVSSINSMVFPEDWVITKEASDVNGLTHDILCKLGMPISVLLPACMALMTKADLRVAHNAEFDAMVIASALWRHIIKEDSEETAHNLIKFWLDLPSYCTMKEAKAIVNAKNKRGQVKYPRLTEAYKFFFDRDLNRAHSANADAIATLEIYLALQK